MKMERRNIYERETGSTKIFEIIIFQTTSSIRPLIRADYDFQRLC